MSYKVRIEKYNDGKIEDVLYLGTADTITEAKELEFSNRKRIDNCMNRIEFLTTWNKTKDYNYHMLYRLRDIPNKIFKASIDII